MKFTVTLRNGETRTVDAHSYEPSADIVTFYNDTRTPIASFREWADVFVAKTESEQPQGA